MINSDITTNNNEGSAFPIQQESSTSTTGGMDSSQQFNQICDVFTNILQIISEQKELRKDRDRLLSKHTNFSDSLNELSQQVETVATIIRKLKQREKELESLNQEYKKQVESKDPDTKILTQILRKQEWRDIHREKLLFDLHIKDNKTTKMLNNVKKTSKQIGKNWEKIEQCQNTMREGSKKIELLFNKNKELLSKIDRSNNEKMVKAVEECMKEAEEMMEIDNDYLKNDAEYLYLRASLSDK